MNPLCRLPCLISAIALVLLAWSPPARAQAYRTKVYTELDGLSSAAIYSIVQAPDGRMCVGTRTGILMYDGSSWEPQVVPGLAVNRRLDVLGTEAGELLAVEHKNPHRTFRFDGKAWTPFLPPLPPEVASAPLGQLAALGRGAQLRVVIATQTGPAALWNGERWALLPREDGGPLSEIVVANGQFIAMGKWGLVQLAPDSAPATFVRIQTPPGVRFHAMAKLPGTERVRVLGQGLVADLVDGLLEVNPEAQAFDPHPLYRPTNAIADELGGLYLGSSTRAQYHDPGRGSIYLSRNNGFYTASMTCAVRDREGLIWMGSLRGLTKLYPRSWLSLDSRHGPSEDEVTVIRELRDGNLFLGHPGSITILGDPVQTRRVSDGSSSRRILAAVEAMDGSLLLAAAEDGLLRYSRQDDSLTRLHLLSTASLDPCRFVFHDNRGRLTALSRDRVLRKEGEGWIQLPAHPGILRSNPRQIIDGEAGALLVCTGKFGVVEVDAPAPRQWTSPTTPLANDVVCLFRQADGVIWAGTMAGLYQLEGTSMLAPLDVPGLVVERPVFFLTADHEGNTWIGTDRGVIRWNGESARHFSALDGLHGTETNRGAWLCDSQGRMWFGTDRGATVHDLRLEPTERAGPGLEVITLTGQGKDAEVLAESEADHEITHHRDTLVAELKTISFVDERRVRHSTWLEGHEAGWSEPAILRSPHLIYPNLPPGRYRLHARAIDVNGKQSQTVTSPWIRVVPPLWARPWFLVLASGLGLAGLAISIGYAAKHRFARELEVTVTARTQDLAVEKNRLETTLSHICDGVVLLSTEGKIAFWNRAAEEITGWTATDSIGMGIQERFGVPDVGPRRSTGVVAIRNSGGETRVIEATTAPIPGAPDSLARVIAFRDITDRQQNEQDLARARHLDSLGKLAGGIAHDFNNLLTVVMGNLALIEQVQGPNPKGQRRIESINAAVTQARSLTQQLITFSEGGEPLRSPGEIEPLLRDAAKLLLMSPEVQCDLQIDPNLNLVEMDSAQMAQVFQNLVLNATQAMGGRGKIKIRARNDSAPTSIGHSPQVVIEVEDNGPGIAPGILHQVFEPYFSTKPEGTGLGLAMAHSIVSRHGGSLRAESRRQEGALFRVVLPATHFPANSASPAQESDPQAPGGLSILVMDDEEGVRDVMQSMLESLGHHCVTTADGLAAIERYRAALGSQNPFDLVILDLTVPGGVGGKRAVTELLVVDPAVRAIAMSGYANEPILARHAEYGFCGRLSKPYGMDELRDVLRSAMDPGAPSPTSPDLGFAP